MIVLQDNDLKQIYGGVNVYNTAKTWAQLGGMIGAPAGALTNLVYGLHSQNLSFLVAYVGFPIAGGILGLAGGVLVGGAIGASWAGMKNIAEYTSS